MYDLRNWLNIYIGHTSGMPFFRVPNVPKCCMPSDVVWVEHRDLNQSLLLDLVGNK